MSAPSIRISVQGAASAKFSSFAEAVDAIGYVAACQKYPELKAAYRRKK